MVHFVKNARKSPGKCQKCDKVIAVGTSYKWIKLRFAEKQIRCVDCPTWKASELTTSDKLSRLYAAQEKLEQELADWDREDADSVREALREAAEEVREVAQEYRDSAGNIEDGFGHSTSKSDELNERADEIEAWADDLDGAAEDIVDFDEGEVDLSEVEAKLGPRPESGNVSPVAETPPEWMERQQDWDGRRVELRAEALSDGREAWADEIASKVEDTTGSMP